MKKLLFGLLWFVAFYFLFCMGVGGVAGGIAGSKHQNTAAAQKAGQLAGEKAVNEYLGAIVGTCLTLSILGSGFGLLPGTGSRRPPANQPAPPDSLQSLLQPTNNFTHYHQ